MNVHIKPLLPTDSSFDHFSKVPKLGLFTFTQLSKGYYIRLMWNDEREDPKPCLTFFLRKVAKVQKYQRIIEHKVKSLVLNWRNWIFEWPAILQTFTLKKSQSSTTISLKHWDTKWNFRKLSLSPIWLQHGGVFLHSFFIDFLSCMKARLTCNKKKITSNIFCKKKVIKVYSKKY